MTKRLRLALRAITTINSYSFADNWAHWRGPTGNGVAPTATPPTTWNETKSVAWTINRDTPDIASPLLSSGRLYFYKGKSGLLPCVDAATGQPYYSAS